MALHMNDIINSPFNKPKEEVSSKTMFLSSPAEPIKPLSIKVDKTVNGSDGSTTKFTVSMEHSFNSPEELKGILDAVGYCGKKGILDRIKAMMPGGK
jgi:hypothetical protein